MLNPLEKSIASYSIRQCLKNQEKFIWASCPQDMEKLIEAEYPEMKKPIADYVAFMVWDFMVSQGIIQEENIQY